MVLARQFTAHAAWETIQRSHPERTSWAWTPGKGSLNGLVDWLLVKEPMTAVVAPKDGFGLSGKKPAKKSAEKASSEVLGGERDGAHDGRDNQHTAIAVCDVPVLVVLGFLVAIVVCC